MAPLLRYEARAVGVTAISVGIENLNGYRARLDVEGGVLTSEVRLDAGDRREQEDSERAKITARSMNTSDPSIAVTRPAAREQEKHGDYGSDDQG
jgi:hypothetical protein